MATWTDSLGKAATRARTPICTASLIVVVWVADVVAIRQAAAQNTDAPAALATLQAPANTTAQPPATRIGWRSGDVQTAPMAPADAAGVVASVARAGSHHLVVQFSRPLIPEQRRTLTEAGLVLLRYIGNNAYFAGLSAGGLDGNALATVRTLVYASPIDSAWKLHPTLLAGEIVPWSVVPRRITTADGPRFDYAVGEDNPRVGAYVMFHPDVALADGVFLARLYGATILSRLESINALVIELPFENMFSLADEDAVQWIEPPLPLFRELNDSNRQRVGANIVQAAPYDLDGSGVTVLVYDGGVGRSSHEDFGGRHTARDNSGQSNHATHTAGTVGGDGARSGGMFRGMAPGVTIEAYGFQMEGGLRQGFLFSEPGDLEADYDEAINVYGADIANNSIGTNTAGNGFPCEWEGNYGVTSALIDAIVTGSLGAPFRTVWANGNERGAARCGTTYHTTAPPACAKNHITVGALTSTADSVTSFTSWGPADDGRLKPDISAPGCERGGDGGVTSCSSNGNYTVMCGTSMSAPTVCGLGALLLQDFRAQFPASPDPRCSTVKAIFAHTAEDIQELGPDYKTGYGSVRIEPAINLLRAGNFLEAEVDQGGSYFVIVVVDPNDTELKVTLAWDDVPAAPNVTDALVNDLDLRVFDLNARQHFPWTLDPANPSQPAVRTQPDHVNNIVQVVIDDPPPGAYRVEVFGFNVPQGPQTFSLAASPSVRTCSSQGIIALDRPKYACSSDATIQVVDCDLNLDDFVVESVAVTIESDTEPAGETVVLTETGPATAVFIGGIPLMPAGGAGVLVVTEGDLVTATYIDADNGQGGINVAVTASAPVDCTPPIISNVQVINVQPQSAVVTFETDELASGAIRYGRECGNLVVQTSAAGFSLTHSIALTDLIEGTDYFFVVDARDEASNLGTDDNGGSCYRFMTVDVPSYFTELFVDNNDLSNTSILFVPDGSVDRYAACAVPIASLPTDPAGGNVLELADNATAAIDIAGPLGLPLYGVTHFRLHVGSNGYLTFTGGDVSRTESIRRHFQLVRVSALFDDLDPSAGGTVSWKQFANRFAVTWENVPEAGTTNSNTFQIEMFFDGRIQMSWLDLDAIDGLAGLSAGGGIPPDFLESDLSASDSCGFDPRGDLNCDGDLNGADIDPFFLALGNPELYALVYPGCDILRGDINGDGALNGADIDGFFACLGAGGCP